MANEYLEKLRSVGVVKGDWHDKVSTRRVKGEGLVKDITDEFRATTTQHKDGRQDVTIRPEPIDVAAQMKLRD